MNERYKLIYGRFGAYFYDDQEKKELDLSEVLRLLNNGLTKAQIDMIIDMNTRIEIDIHYIKNRIKQQELKEDKNE